MKYTWLALKSALVIVVLAGAAHYFSSVAIEQPETTTTEMVVPVSSETVEAETDFLEGLWKVRYRSTEFNGNVVFSIKKENDRYNAYMHQYEDEHGYSEEADGEKALEITQFDGAKGSGIYPFEYENEVYEIECDIKKVDENTFELSYDYYGYSDTETWKRQ
ncbi:MAG: hypothetical protein AAF466_11790 [Bacteroidota bacterium]